MRLTRRDCYLIPIFAPAVAIALLVLVLGALQGCNSSDAPAPAATTTSRPATIGTTDDEVHVQRVRVADEEFLVFTTSRGAVAVIRPGTPQETLR